MIKTYNEQKSGKVKIFFQVNEYGEVNNVFVGNQAVATGGGFQFYVDYYVAEQIHKCELYIDGLTPRLQVKEGETLFVPDENDEYKKQKEIEELERKIKELKGDEDNEV